LKKLDLAALRKIYRIGQLLDKKYEMSLRLAFSAKNKRGMACYIESD
jgi:hypothetical protein